MIAKMSFSQEQLKKAVESVFNTYDRDKNGSLDADEVAELINDALKQMKQNRKVSEKQLCKFIEGGDKDGSRSISK